MALEGQTLQLVHGLPIITKNYSVAWDLLVDREENDCGYLYQTVTGFKGNQ